MELNTLQQIVVDELEKNIFLIASAGTGKTTTLACRIANIIKKGYAKPEEILCLTFTNRACIEIKEKIIDELEQQNMATEALDVIVKTFHSFCCDLVRFTAKKTSDLFTDFVVFDEEDCKNIISTSFGNANVASKIQKFIKQVKIKIGLLDLYFDNKFQNYQAAINYIYENEQPFLNSCFRKHSELIDRLKFDGAKLMAVYDRRLNETHGLDFEDLIIYANNALQNVEIRKIWQNTFKFINIDEVQDTSELEYKIISKVFGNSNLLLCGDPFQTIYEWRGSRPKLIEEQFKLEYQPLVIVLDENYRSTKTLLHASYTYLKNRFYDEVKMIYPNDIKVASYEKGENIFLHEAENFCQEAQWIYKQIKNLNINDSTKICVLTRENDYNRGLVEAFEKINQSTGCDIPFMLIGEYYFFRRQEIKDILAFMKFAVNKHDGISLGRVIKRFIKGIGDTTIEEINSKDYREAGIRLTDFIEPSTHQFGDPYEELLQALEMENVVVFDVESTGLDTTTDEIIQIAAIRLRADGSIKSEFMRYLKPTKSVGRSVNIHKLTDDFLSENGQDAVKVFADFVKFAENAVLVGHNVNYDLNILTSQMSRLSMTPLHYQNYYDTLDIFRRFYPRLDNHKLATLGEFCNVTHKSTHDAYDDICATAEILNYAVEKNILPTLEQRRQFICKHLKNFESAMELMSSIREKVNILRPKDLTALIIDTFGIKKYYEQQKEFQRIEYINDLQSFVNDFDDPNLSPLDAIQRILQYVTMSNTELFLRNEKKIPVITVNQAKGMEFDYVFVAGLMENTFPSYLSIINETIKEESRLFYVAITRAKKKLYLSYETSIDKKHNKAMSRFINDIPQDVIQRIL